MHVSSVEYLAVCRALGQAQCRCTELMAEHRRREGALRAELQRQRVRALLTVTRLHWGLADDGRPRRPPA